MKSKKLVVEILKNVLNIPESEIKPDSKLTDLVNDSIQLFELLVRFEKELDRQISYEEIANLETVGDIINFEAKVRISNPEALRYSIASDKKKRRETLDLVKKVYSAEGYVENNARSDSKDTYGASTTVFCAYKDNSLFGTISLIEDSPQGLPLDIIYKNYLKHLRESGNKIAEVGRFAVDHSLLQEKGLSTALPLLSLMFQCALERSIDYLCITVNPKHDSFYQSIGFTELGELKHHPSVNHAPAVLRILEVKKFLNKEKYQAILKDASNITVTK